MDAFSFAHFAPYYPHCCNMFPTKFPHSSVAEGEGFRVPEVLSLPTKVQHFDFNGALSSHLKNR
jgi:hypothetical protein